MTRVRQQKSGRTVLSRAGAVAVIAALALAPLSGGEGSAFAVGEPDDCTPPLSAPEKVEDVYQITSAGELKLVADDVDLWDQKFLLMNDISLANCGNWVPIGNAATKFTGTFDGGEKTISGLFIDRNADHEIGLFGYSIGASFQNVTLVDVDVTGLSKVGALVGLFGGSTSAHKISNSSVTGSVKGTEDVGGLVGYFQSSGNVESSDASVNVTGSGLRVGGLVGHFLNSGNIVGSHASGSVTSSGRIVGGLVGRFRGSGDMSDSYATGAVTGGLTLTSGQGDVGGLVGAFDQSGAISNSWASGDVKGVIDRVGGLVGFINSPGRIEGDSFATGTVTGDRRQIGGLVGRAINVTIRSAYATGNVIATGATSTAEEVGGLVGYADDADLTSVYATGSVTVSNPSTNGRFGGLVGRASFSRSLIAGSYATGAVVAGNYSGGLVGLLSSGAAVESSYASGSVVGSNDVGGLVGGVQDANSDIAESFASGSATGQNRVGGLVGSLDTSANVEDSYSTGRATGVSDVGGLVGSAAAGETVVNSFWDTQTSQLTTSAGGTGKTTVEMLTIDTYTSVTPPWQIVPATGFGDLDPLAGEAWGIGAGVNCGYPFLYWQEFSAHSCPQTLNQAGVSGGEEKRARSAAIALDLDAIVGDFVAGAPVVIGGEGLAGPSAYSLVVRSTPQILDSGSATVLGNFSKRVTLPNLPPGSHTLTLSAIAPDASVLTLTQTFTVAANGTFSAIGSATGTQTGGLAATGVNGLAGGMGLAGLALLLGVAMVLSARRYQRTD